MKTDDFLADLERQLAGARPRRRPPAAMLLVVPALAAILALALLRGGDGDREREAVPAKPGAAVVVENGTGSVAVGAQVKNRLQAAGYQVTLRKRPGGAPDSAILNADSADEHHIAALLGLEDAGGWTNYAPLDGPPYITVILGKNDLGGGVAPIALLDASDDPALAAAAERRLEAADQIVGQGGGPLPQQPTQVLGRDASDADQVALVRRALDLPPGPPETASRDFIEQWVGESPARVIVVVGADYEPPLEVAVINAGSPDGSATDLAAMLEGDGVRTTVHNSPDTDLPESAVTGPADEARTIAGDLGLPYEEDTERFAEERHIASDADVLIVLGTDFTP